MAICTAAQAVSASEYWVGYKEKATSAYSTVRDKSAFTANAGSNNYAYPAYIAGCNGQSWCAATVNLFILEACSSNKSDAKTVMHGVYPYINVTQIYDAAPASYKGRAKSWGGTWSPQAGDIVIFDWEHDAYRDHTGMVISVTSTSIVVREGNSSNMVKDNTYSLSASTLWGYVRPAYASATSGGTVAGSTNYGTDVTVKLPTLKYGSYGPAVKSLQRILYSYYGSAIAVDGKFGSTTSSYVQKLQAHLGIKNDGEVGVNTWTAFIRELDT